MDHVNFTDVEIASQRQREGRASDFAAAAEQPDQSMFTPVREAQPSTSVSEGILLRNPHHLSRPLIGTPFKDLLVLLQSCLICTRQIISPAIDMIELM